MELLTKQIIRKFEEHPIYSQDGKGLKAEVLVKLSLIHISEPTRPY